ncbi:TrmH family RNA methyltransferase [Glycomyces harbinensis]|uniref:RNA methyltransferase, TrmH family n=2 Tax=Glycomyces harbinensis TaxID=58114 RepID=A0A1G6WU51_9ACTN|nr:RNA methyltransferase [Glycomyces harbinensis]SDD69470.1 RNA methyltransferase, TrmH family [Glycomyces harbinensis]
MVGIDWLRVGVGHPAVRDVLNIARNTAPNRFNLVVADGLWAVELALELGSRLDRFFYAPELVRSSNAAKVAIEAASGAYRAYEVSAKTMQRMSERDAPEGLLALVAMPRWDPAQIELSEDALIFVTDGIEIPGNLGTLLRTADGAHAELLVMTNRRTRMSHPKVFRSSKGMSLHVPHIEFGQVDDAISWLTERGVHIYLADTQDSVHYRTMDCSGRTAIVVGNERYGITNPWYGHGFPRVGVPMLGVADSLNVSISAAILAYEARARKHHRQRCSAAGEVDGRRVAAPRSARSRPR